jgi:hypothetical protein
MLLKVDTELREICEEIVERDQSLEDWRETESDDEFQTDHYEGGYDADEDAFCFSHHAPDGEELWFQVTLAEVERIAEGEISTVEARPAE